MKQNFYHIEHWSQKVKEDYGCYQAKDHLSALRQITQNEVIKVPKLRDNGEFYIIHAEIFNGKTFVYEVKKKV